MQLNFFTFNYEYVEDVLDLIASHKDTLQVSTKKVMELQRYNRSLYQELQVAHQNKVSLQEALLEATEQGTCTCTCVT